MDRFSRGLVAGLTGGILMNLWNFFSYYTVHLATYRYLDWASVVLFGHLPTNLAETVYALITQLLWAATLGIVFAYIIPHISSTGYLLKGAFWGFVTGFIMYATATLLRAPYFTKISFGTAISQFIGGIIWGLSLAYVLRLLDKRNMVD